MAVHEGKTVKTDVITGNEADSNTEVISGLKSDEQIIATANDEIKEGGIAKP